MPQWRYLSEGEVRSLLLKKAEELPGLDPLLQVGIFPVIEGVVASYNDFASAGAAAASSGGAAIPCAGVEMGWYVLILDKPVREPWCYVTLEMKVLLGGHTADMALGVPIALLTPEIVEKVREWSTQAGRAADGTDPESGR